MTAETATNAVLRADTGETIALETGGWHAPATAEEQELLAAVDGPVIDLGCGPGRLVASLATRRVPALGVDSSPAAVALTRRRGASAVERDIFGPLPGEGRWATALVFDGNIGIGGDPTRLLGRCRELIASEGRILVEVEPPGIPWRRLTAWVESDGRRSDVFPWAVVGVDAIDELARPSGMQVSSVTETASGRWFAHLQCHVGPRLPAPDRRNAHPYRAVTFLPWSFLFGDCHARVADG